MKYEECLSKKNLAWVEPSVKIAEETLKEAEKDFETAEDLRNREKYKWATEAAYYSMFNCAKSLLELIGLKERTHVCLIAGLNEHFIKTKKLHEKFLEYISTAKFRREQGTYSLSYSSEIANKQIEHAWEFLQETKKLIKAAKR